MNTIGSNSGTICPYMEKCYRKNPIHFSEMSHPHLEKLVVDQLDDTIKVPAHLDFECADRSQLLDQLKVLQMVLRRRRDAAKGNEAPPKNDTSETKVSPATPKKQNNLSDDIKEKIEKHKKIAAQRREDKLKKLDATASALSKPSTSNGDESDSKITQMKNELKEIRLHDNDPNEKPPQGKKRVQENFNHTIQEKRSKMIKDDGNDRGQGSDESRRNDKRESQTDTSNSSTSKKGNSLIDSFSSCDSMKSRDEVRRKALDMMRMKGFNVSIVEPGEFALKHALSAPYHLFFTRVEKSKATYDQQFSVTFPEILDRSLGEIVSSLQINFMIDVGWVCLQYLLAGQRNDMLVLYGERVDTEKLPPNITLIPINMPSAFGTHHTKLMILKYKDNGIRIVVSTANLYSDDWENRTQGLWISPHLPPLPEDASPNMGESKTGFKKDFEKYLLKYNQRALTEWVYLVRRADFSAVNVFFVASVPGSHKALELNMWGLRKLSYVLSKHATLPPDAPQWSLIAQSSSIGSLGANFESWLSKEVVPSMSMETAKGIKSHPNFQFVYPTINNYKQSFDCQTASCCLPYSMKTHSKQPWLEAYMYQWKANRTARDRAMPHIKSYTRLSPDLKKISWFVLTSANLSKAAWGNTSKTSHFIMNYEVGVVFVPKIITGETSFPIVKEKENSSVPAFPIAYDLPLTRYSSTDKPFVTEFFQNLIE